MCQSLVKSEDFSPIQVPGGRCEPTRGHLGASVCTEGGASRSRKPPENTVLEKGSLHAKSTPTQELTA